MHELAQFDEVSDMHSLFVLLPTIFTMKYNLNSVTLFQ